jgi:predicted nucleic acid-binding protein
VDASVALKWFVPEEGSSDAVTLLSGASGLLAPDLLYPEFGNALWKQVRRGVLAQADARWAVAALRKVSIRVQPTAVLLPSALEIALRHGLSVYDGIYVALAVREGCQLVTADARLRQALQGTEVGNIITVLSEMR